MEIKGDVENANVAIGDNVQQTIHNYGISKQDYDRYVKELGVTDCALENFFRILERNQVPRHDLDMKLREIAENYKKLLQNAKLLEQSEDGVVQGYLRQARQFIEGQADADNDCDIDLAKADELLQQAFEQEQENIEKLLAVEQRAKAIREKKTAICG